MLTKKYSLAIKTQTLYAFLCIIWNGVVIGQVKAGVQPIGTTGSMIVIIGALILVALLYYFLRRGWEGFYIVVSSIVSAFALFAVSSSIIKSSDLWPSEFWRTAGILVNVIGILSMVIVITIYVKGRNAELN